MSEVGRFLWRVLNLCEPKKHQRMCKLVDGDVLAKIPANSKYHTTTHQAHHTCLPVHKEGFPQHYFQPLRQTSGIFIDNYIFKLGRAQSSDFLIQNSIRLFN